MLDFDDCKIELLENFPCNSNNELLVREGYYHRLHRPFIVNIVISKRTMEEWRKDNKDHIKDYSKKYYEENKEQMLEKTRQYNTDNKERIKIYKQARDKNNRAVLLEKEKAYRAKNIEKINARNQALEKCDICNIEVKHRCFLSHTRSKTHIKNSQPNLDI